VSRLKKEILEPGSMFGRYRIERRIGAGGMGAVYEAVHTGLGKRVAIKALIPEMASDPEVQVRFLREGESAAKIQHPNVVDIYDVGTQDDITYLVMEYLEGRDLSGRLKKEGTLSVEKAADAIVPVVAALLTAHERGIVHRDLKPANIFLAEGPHGMMTPKVLDFGISKIKTNAPSEELTTTGALLGTPYYMSPEQAAGSKQLDARSDQYSLGVILYQCVTGKRPFEADSMYKILHRIVQGEFEPPRKVRPELPPEFERLLMTAMATKPDHRYPSMKELGRALLPFAGARTRARWEPIFGEALSSTDLPSTYPGHGMAALAEPLAITHDGPHTTARPAPPAGRSRLFLMGGVLLVLSAGIMVALTVRDRPAPITAEKIALDSVEPPPPPVVPKYDVSLSVTPATATIEIDGRTAGTGSFAGTFAKDGTRHVVRISADGYQPKTIELVDGPPSESTIALEKIERRPKPKVARRKKKTEAEPPKPAVKKGANDALIIR
jgi:serine/threonine-protein kinase